MKASYSDVEHTAEVDYSLTLVDCQSISILQSKFRKACLALECCRDLAYGLGNSWRAIGAAHGFTLKPETVVGLDLYATEMASYSKNVEALLERSYDIGGLLAKILNSREVEKDRKTSQAIEKGIIALESISKETSETSRTLADIAKGTSKDSLTLKALATFEFRHTFGSDSSGLDDKVEYDLITVLAVAQKLEIEMLALTWQSSQERVGSGRTSQISQMLVNSQTSFVFKRIADRSKLYEPEDRVFRWVINEMTALCHPSIRGHPNVAELQGLCWTFLKQKTWNVVKPQPRLGRFLFSKRVIHGDIKPQNVLVFKDQATDKFTAKVIDFGFSSRYVDDDDLLRLARTPPWDAPELRKYTEVKPIDARRADVFSYGMLCLWILFEQSLSSDDITWLQLNSQLETTDDLVRLATLKADNKLISFTDQMLERENLENEKKEQLQDFFELSLDINPNLRPNTLQHLLVCLDPKSEEEAKAMLELSGKQESDLRQELSSFASPTSKWTRSAIFGELFELGHIAVSDMAGYYREHDLLQDAEQMIRREIGAVKKAVGDHCPCLMDLLQILCAVLSNQGKLEEAKKLQKKTLEEAKMIFGQDHFTTLNFMEILGSTYRIEGQQDQAEELAFDVMQKREETLGLEHPATLNAKDLLASIYRDRGRWAEAQDLGLSVVQVSRKTFGEEHFATMTSMENLASTYRAQGKWEEAVSVGEQVLKLSRMVYGDKSPIVLVSMGNLVKAYNSQRRLEDAEKMATEAKTACLSILGMEHTVTLYIMSNLATTYQLQGRWREAEEMGTSVMEGQLAHVGEESPFTQLNMTGLASTYRLQGK
ncbi:hypothetical protein IL306_010989 [Fusarium sp. DS 682]|nr:hypothetical protein IL306_010989 [Fusarium sp. DS 682]